VPVEGGWLLSGSKAFISGAGRWNACVRPRGR
jgi:alkylation response protein AidB-like acyl-CoA dehydrogenase